MLAPRVKKLADEITADPLGRGYASMTDAQVVADLTDPRYVRLEERYATARTLATVWGVDRAGAVLATLRALAANDPGVDLTVRLLDDISGQGVDLSLAQSRAQIDAFVTTGLVTPAEGDALKALAEVPESRAKQLGYDTVPEAWITTIRAGG